MKITVEFYVYFVYSYEGEGMEPGERRIGTDLPMNSPFSDGILQTYWWA
jgi:hypothetical protein